MTDINPVLPTISNHTITITIPPNILWSIFAVTVLVTTVMSLVLFYHWNRYGYGVTRRWFAATLYLGGTFILTGIIFSAISAYIISI